MVTSIRNKGINISIGLGFDSHSEKKVRTFLSSDF